MPGTQTQSILIDLTTIPNRCSNNITEGGIEALLAGNGCPRTSSTCLKGSHERGTEPYWTPRKPHTSYASSILRVSTQSRFLQDWHSYPSHNSDLLILSYPRQTNICHMSVYQRGCVHTHRTCSVEQVIVAASSPGNVSAVSSLRGCFDHHRNARPRRYLPSGHLLSTTTILNLRQQAV